MSRRVPVYQQVGRWCITLAQWFRRKATGFSYSLSSRDHLIREACGICIHVYSNSNSSRYLCRVNTASNRQAQAYGSRSVTCYLRASAPSARFEPYYLLYAVFFHNSCPLNTLAAPHFIYTPRYGRPSQPACSGIRTRILSHERR